MIPPLTDSTSASSKKSTLSSQSDLTHNIEERERRKDKVKGDRQATKTGTKSRSPLSESTQVASDFVAAVVVHILEEAFKILRAHGTMGTPSGGLTSAPTGGGSIRTGGSSVGGRHRPSGSASGPHGVVTSNARQSKVRRYQCQIPFKGGELFHDPLRRPFQGGPDPLPRRRPPPGVELVTVRGEGRRRQHWMIAERRSTAGRRMGIGRIEVFVLQCGEP